jgi:hypothetical protein
MTIFGLDDRYRGIGAVLQPELAGGHAARAVDHGDAHLAGPIGLPFRLAAEGGGVDSLAVDQPEQRQSAAIGIERQALQLSLSETLYGWLAGRIG